MGFFKKPDINSDIYLTYNMLHKPALLGILGAISGLNGYEKNGVWPEYYLKLRGVPVGIQPLNHDKGNYTKAALLYNNSVGYASQEEGGNLMIKEQLLIAPSYRCYVLLNPEVAEQSTLIERLINQEADYIPYLGKNEFAAWWDNVTEHKFSTDKDIKNAFKINTLFIRNQTISLQKSTGMFNFTNMSANDFMYFERLPMGFNESLRQYELAEFVYTTFSLKPDTQINNLYFLKELNHYVQLN